MVEHWLSSPDIDINDVATAVEDFLLAGVHTSSYAASFLMYNLARNPEAQAKLSEECQKILEQSGGQITQKTVADATYALACLKESLRIHPVAVGTGRQLNKVRNLKLNSSSNVSLSGHNIQWVHCSSRNHHCSIQLHNIHE